MTKLYFSEPLIFCLSCIIQVTFLPLRKFSFHPILLNYVNHHPFIHANDTSNNANKFTMSLSILT